MIDLPKLLLVVLQPQANSKEALLEALRALDDAAKDPSLPPKLRHYLERRSYEKAQAFLDEQG